MKISELKTWRQIHDDYLATLTRMGQRRHARRYIKIRNEVDSVERKHRGIDRLRTMYGSRRR